MDLTTILLPIVAISVALNIFLLIKVMHLQKELSAVKQSTKLTREEIEKLNERLKKLKMGG
jgi:uncharacterized protein YoxC